MGLAAVKYVIDTHALIWFLEGNSRLGAEARHILEAPDSALLLPAIALAESVWIVARGKTSIPSVAALLAVVKADPRVTVLPLDVATITKTCELISINEMHDRQIVAAALILKERGESVQVVSLDQNIKASAVIEVVW